MPDDNLSLTIVALNEAAAGVVGAKYVLRLQSPLDQFWFIVDWQFHYWKLFEDSSFSVDWARMEQDLLSKGAATCAVRGKIDHIRMLLEHSRPGALRKNGQVFEEVLGTDHDEDLGAETVE